MRFQLPLVSFCILVGPTVPSTRSPLHVTAEFWWPEGLPREAAHSYRKEKETHELIFSWLSWLVVLLLSWSRIYNDHRVAQDGGHMPA